METERENERDDIAVEDRGVELRNSVPAEAMVVGGVATRTSSPELEANPTW